MLPGRDRGDFRSSTTSGMGGSKKFQAAIPAYEEKIAELAEDKVDLIHPAGTPPFMLLGYKGEAEIYCQMGKAVRSSHFYIGDESSGGDEGGSRSKSLSASVTTSTIPALLRRYFTDAGFNVLELAKLPGPWEEVGRLSSKGHLRLRRESCFCAIATRTGFISRAANCASSISSNRWNRIFGVPVIHPGVTQCWEIQKRLRVRQPQKGYGQLLAGLRSRF